MMSYFVMECRGRSPLARVSLVTELDNTPWMTGAVIKEPGQVIEYKVHSKIRGNLKAMYEFDVPLFRKDLLQALFDAGVDNLQLFDAVIRDRVDGVSFNNYFAFNVVGVVSAADMEKSVLMHEETLSDLDHDFSSLVIDTDKVPKDLLLFRLAESVNAIVVHQKVKDLIEQRKIEGMVFYESGVWSG